MSQKIFKLALIFFVLSTPQLLLVAGCCCCLLHAEIACAEDERVPKISQRDEFVTQPKTFKIFFIIFQLHYFKTFSVRNLFYLSIRAYHMSAICYRLYIQL